MHSGHIWLQGLQAIQAIQYISVLVDIQVTRVTSQWVATHTMYSYSYYQKMQCTVLPLCQVIGRKH